MLQHSKIVMFVTMALCNLTEIVSQDLNDVRHVCPHLPPLSHGNYTGLKEYYLPGDVVNWTCDVVKRNLLYSGEYRGTLTCTHNYAWTKPDPECPSTTCHHPGHIQHGGYYFNNGSDYSTGNVADRTIIYVKCTEGYLPSYPYIVCLLNDKWTFGGTCERSCPNITDRHGTYIFSVKLFEGFEMSLSWTSSGNFQLPGTTAKLNCNEGFRASGNDSLLCDNLGLWSGLQSKCVPTCKVPHIPNGTFVDEKDQPLEHFDSGQSAKLICGVGYEVTPAGNGTDDENYAIQCINHKWSGIKKNCTATLSKINDIADADELTPTAVIIGGIIGALLIVVSILLVIIYRRRISSRHKSDEEVHASDLGYPSLEIGKSDEETQATGVEFPTPGGTGNCNDKTNNTYVNMAPGPIYDNATPRTVVNEQTSEQDSEEYMYARLYSDKYI